MPQPILVSHSRSPGDVICMTACVRDLAMSYPERYAIHIGGACPELWQNNPHIAKFWGARRPTGMPCYELSYGNQLRNSNQIRRHFLTAFHEALGSHLGHSVPVLQARGDLHLSPSERMRRPLEHPYWILVAGGKSQIETKIWSAARFQQVVDMLHSLGVRIVQVGGIQFGHQHPRLTNVKDLVGKTSLRDVLRWIWHSDGVICPVTFAMHAAAAFEKPCVVLAGGREPWWWESYENAPESHFGPDSAPVRVPHRFLHTQEQFDCCRNGGCWKTTITQPSGVQATNCDLPVNDGYDQLIPACLEVITPSTVVKSVLSYYTSEARRELFELGASLLN